VKKTAVGSTARRTGWRARRAAAAAVGLVVITASGPQAGNPRDPAWELVYLFDAANALHLDRADQLHAAIASVEAPVALFGVVADREALEAVRGPFEASARAWAVESELLTAADARRAGLGPQGGLPARGDRLALRDGTGGEVAAAAGTQMEQVLQRLQAVARVAGAGISTDVNFTTWGKVKDLFR